jgi:polyhydroxyalkanoate synthesis repressor PhaR
VCHHLFCVGEGTGKMTEKLTIKKYVNRRLYDTEKSIYITLDDISRIIREGREVNVVDAKTKEDVTAFILTQIILEESRRKNSLLPVPLLHLIIQYGENVLSEFFDKYLQQTLKNYLAYKTHADDQFKKWLDIGSDLSQITQKTLSEISSFKPFLKFFPDTKESKENKT